MTPVKKTVYLHIGMHKTGTTAIQNFFALNREVLKEKGVLYPGDLVTHHEIGWEVRRTSVIDNLTGENSWTRKILDEISRSGLPVAVLSSETFVEIRTIAPRLKQAIDRILGDSAEIKILFYCRRQDHSLQSAYQQKIQPWAKNPLTIPISEFIRDTRSLQEWDYYEKLEPWRTAFGRDAIIVRVYEKEQFYQQDLIRDFLHVIGLELTDEFQIPPANRSNIGLSHDAAEFMRVANLGIGDYDTKVFLLSMLQAVGAKRIFEPYSLLSPREQYTLLQVFAESNQKVAREYLGREDGVLFFERVPDPEDPWTPYEGLTVEKIIPLFVSMMYEMDKKYRPGKKMPVSRVKENPEKGKE